MPLVVFRRRSRALPVIVTLLIAFATILAGSSAVAAASAALLPPSNPAHSLTLDEHVHPDCRNPQDHSAACLDGSVAMLNAGRRSEHLGPLVLPRNWARLTVVQQIFVLTELERTARGLKPDTGLAADWNAAAQAGADAGEDPSRAGAGSHGFMSIWAGGQENPIIATVGWIYDDAFFPDGTTPNIACSKSSRSGCWGHRDNILRDSAATACGRSCAVGAGYSAGGFAGAGSSQGRESYTEVFGVEAANNPDRLIFRWTWELSQLPACERSGDTCSWTGQPLWTETGAVNVRGLARGASLVKPWFPVRTDWTSSGTGAVTLSVAVGTTLPTLTVTADQSGHHRTLHVTRQAGDEFVATGQLTSGHWTVTIRYRTPAIDGPQASSTETVTVP